MGSRHAGSRPVTRRPHLQRRWAVPLTISALWALIVRLDRCLRPYSRSRAVHDDVMLAVVEALSNAFGSARNLARGARIIVRLRVSPRQVTIDVRDPGGGFAAADRVRDLVQADREGGRGLFLIEQVMDEVSWSARGNGIRMVRRWGGRAA
jgi:anti-sigma regulatory factor (Ser/Thr protein kinase)